MSEFARPEFIGYRIGLVIWALLALALVVQQWLAERRFVAQSLALRFGPAYSIVRALLKWALLCAAGWYLLIALATPLGEPVKVESQASGADVVLAIDVSSSMYAQDIKPNRILALKSAMMQFINRLGGDRVGLVAFAGEAVIACPLTTDYETASLFLDKLETDSVPSDGTGLASAIKLCLDGFMRDDKRGRIIILASDGEDTLDTNTAEQAARAKELGVPIYTLGVGTPSGGMIPGRPDVFGRVMAKLYHGQPIVTKLNPETLRKIANLSGGRYYDGASPVAMNAAYEAVRAAKQGNAKASDRYVRDPLYQEPLFIAILLLLAEMLISNRASGLPRAWRYLQSSAQKLMRRRHATASLWLLAFLALSGFSLDPGRSEYDAANAQYRQGAYEEALKGYEASVAAQPGRPQAQYNLGNARFQGGDYDGAIGAYEEALRLDPKDADAQFNLDLARRKKEENKQQDKNSKGDKKDKNGKDEKGGQKPGQGQQQGQGSGQQKGQGQGPGKPQPGKPGGNPANNLSQDQINAMMNMMKNDQKRYGQAFQPMKKYQKPDDPSQDPVQQMFDEMTGRRRPQQAQGNSNRKDW